MKSEESSSPTDADHRQIEAFLAELPPEVIVNFLSRLRVGRLLCFRSVSKPWRSLIDSSYFKNLHLLYSTRSKSNLHLILLKHSDLYIVDFDSLNDAVELTHPLMCYNNRIRVLGSCNGLLCICNVADDIALWSPWLQKHRIVPSLPSDRSRDKAISFCGARVYGVGYDAVHDDYKLVRFSQFIGWDRVLVECEVKVYSLRLNQWRRVDDMPSYVLCYTQKMGILASGCLHWMVTRTEEPGIEILTGFDLVKETFVEVPMPPGMDRRKCRIDVGYLEGWLCVVANYEGVSVDVWSMKQYGVKESWCKLFTVKQLEGFRRPKSIRPLVYSNNGQVLLEQNHDHLIWFDLESQMVVKTVEIRGLPDLFEATVCAETFVSVDPSKREDKEKQGKNNKKRSVALHLVIYVLIHILIHCLSSYLLIFLAQF